LELSHARAVERLAASPYKTPQEAYGFIFQFSPGVWTQLYRVDFLHRYNEPFPEGMTYEDDYWTFFYLLHANRLSAVNEVLYHYFCNPNSLSRRPIAEHHLRVVLMLQERNKSYLTDPDIAESFDLYKNLRLKYFWLLLDQQGGALKSRGAFKSLKQLFKGVTHFRDAKSRRMILFIQRNPLWLIMAFFLIARTLRNFGRAVRKVIDFRLNIRKRVGYFQLLDHRWSFYR
jgi:hypothetical protein